MLVMYTSKITGFTVCSQHATFLCISVSQSPRFTLGGLETRWTMCRNRTVHTTHKLVFIKIGCEVYLRPYTCFCRWSLEWHDKGWKNKVRWNLKNKHNVLTNFTDCIIFKIQYLPWTKTHLFFIISITIYFSSFLFTLELSFCCQSAC